MQAYHLFIEIISNITWVSQHSENKHLNKKKFDTKQNMNYAGLIETRKFVDH